MPTDTPAKPDQRPAGFTRGLRCAAMMVACAALWLGASGCPPTEKNNRVPLPAPQAKVQAATLSDSIRLDAHDQPVVLTAAKNEWTSFALQLIGLPEAIAAQKGSPLALRLRPLVRKGGEGGQVPLSAFEPYQILPMPVKVNKAGFVRHTGLTTPDAGQLPRALLPLTSNNGLVDLSRLRDPARPTDAATQTTARTPLHLWIDVHVPADAPAGEYEATCDLVIPAPADAKGEAAPERAFGSVPVRLTVYDFALPAERQIQMIGRVEWEGLVRYHPTDFQAVTPRLLNRNDPRYAGTIRTLDELMRLAQRHRLAVYFPRLQPTVKWPANVGNAPPDVDWRDFDSVVEPWFKGNCFKDGVCVEHWPLPKPDYLDNYDLRSRLEYWSQAVTHFDQMDWLGKTSVLLEKQTPGRANASDSIEFSIEAARLLASHPRLRVTLPLEDDQVQLAEKPADAGRLIDPAATPRLLTASPCLVFAPPMHDWPPGVEPPQHWLRTDLPGLVPYDGAGGDERDVRLWAWLAFLRRAQFVMFGSALPWFDRDKPATDDARRPADPNELIWFYPGSWFGVDQPVPTIQLKWLRRAQQDYEYLRLAYERGGIGEKLNTIQMARLITKPVEVEPGPAPDAAYTLMSGTTDAQAWVKAQELLAKSILLTPPAASGAAPAEPSPEVKRARGDLFIETLQWQEPQERPMLMARSTDWSWIRAGNGWVNLQLGLDIYNAAEVVPVNTMLRWLTSSAGWEVRPHAQEVPPLKTYQVRRVALGASLNLDRIPPASARTPLEVDFSINALPVRRGSTLRVMVPVANTDRREGRYSFDGKTDDWTAADAIQDGPMVRMLDRPALQKQELRFATVPAKVYSGWGPQELYVAFDLRGVSKPATGGGQNFVDYQARRAWGEDLCEMLIQPIYDGNTLGPVLHVVCKPNGGSWVERKLDPRLHADPWEGFESTGVRYAAAVNADNWTGEVAIPWHALADAKLGMPRLLRFNFAQHRTATGESASWAGPVDFGRDDAFMGLLHLRIPDAPGMAGAAPGATPGPQPSPRRVDR